jgi:YD repeat-containing protein
MDRLVKYTAPDGTVYEYGYDAFGLRNKVTVNGKTTNYLNDPTGYGYTLTEYRTDETVHYNIVDGIVASQNGDQTYYYNANHLGSVTEITDQNGKTVNAYTYNHEGDILTKTEGIFNPFTYVGIYGIINDENGLIYDRARYVSTETDYYSAGSQRVSTDNGKTWTAPTLVTCGAPAEMLLHSSGVIVMTYGFRGDGEGDVAYGVRARFSFDEGKSWSEEILLDGTAYNSDCGYPASVELSNGSIYTVYYKTDKSGSVPGIWSINWTLPVQSPES